MRRLLPNAAIEAIVRLDAVYGARKDAINNGENERSAALEGQFNLSGRDGRAAFLRACGDETRRLHAENTAWYRSERQKITGMSWDDEMAEHE